MARLLILLFALTLAGAVGAPRTVTPADDRLLMIDPRVITTCDGARLVPGQVTKEPRNPLFHADRPWENALNNLYPNLLWDEEEQIFKLWYKCVLADPAAIAQMDAPSTVHDVGWYLLYATSKDGLEWTKPALGLHRFNGDAATNIVTRDTPNAGVFKDRHESDPSRRYKMVYDVGLGELRTRFSPDGVHWGDPVTMLGFGARNGDTHNHAFWDAREGKYLWFTKLYLGERLVARFESQDFLHWRDNGVVLRSTLTEGRGSQTYCMPAFRYGNCYLAYVMMYHPGTDRTVDAELAWSPDGLHWRRTFPGVPFIPRGSDGSYDSKCIYAMAGEPVEQNGQLLIFYGGDDFPHTGWKRDCIPCLARLPLDHFGGYQPVHPEAAATLLTQPLRFEESGLRLTADASPGSIQLFALDEDDSVLAESQPITTTVSDARVVWRKGSPGPVHRLRIQLQQRATVFSLAGVTLTQPHLPEPSNRAIPAAPATARQVTFDLGPEGWTGVDQLTHPPGQGYVSVMRQGRSLPIAASPSKSPASPFSGDWPTLFGGNGARIRCHVRAPSEGGRVQLELFAGDIAQWACEAEQRFGPDWTEASVSLRYDWSDADAIAAGWHPSPAAFSWSETVANVGKVVIVPAASGALHSFDLDDIQVSGLAD